MSRPRARGGVRAQFAPRWQWWRFTPGQEESGARELTSLPPSNPNSGIVRVDGKTYAQLFRRAGSDSTVQTTTLVDLTVEDPVEVPWSSGMVPASWRGLTLPGFTTGGVVRVR